MYQHEVLKDLISRNKNTKAVVDIGSGHADYLIELAKEHHNIMFYATDVTPTINSGALPNLKRETGNIKRLPYTTNFSDVTSEFACTPLVSYDGDISPAIEEMRRITKTHGFIIFGNLPHKCLVIEHKDLDFAKKLAKAKNLEGIKSKFFMKTADALKTFGMKIIAERLHMGVPWASFICQKTIRIFGKKISLSFIDEHRIGAAPGIILKM